jgi:tetratricopeptide (TPR) repeat protein
MTWVGWLFLLAGIYVLVIVLRAALELVSWFREEYITGPRELRRLKEKPTERLHRPKLTAASETHERKSDGGTDRHQVSPVPAGSVGRARRPSPLARLMKSLKTVVARKGYDYWVASALSEEDPDLKIRYLSKALKLDPTYVPAWGLKGNALFGLGRYEEAMECFDKSLEVHPSALMWYRKGLCCYHLKRHGDAIGCFHHALETCPHQDRQLMEDASRMKELAEDESRAGEVG